VETGALPATLLAAAAGSAVGSFLATAVLRGARGESALSGRSRCPACKRVLSAVELVPVVSFLWWRRCRSCGAAIDPLHPTGEMAGAFAFALAVALTPPSRWPFALALGGWLLALALWDLRTRRLPDPLVLPLAPAFFALAWVQGRMVLDLALPDPLSALAGAVAAGGALLLLRALYGWLSGREGLGMGDVKLAFGLGALSGLPDLPRLLLLAALFGLLHAVAAGALRDPARPVPFGPALSAAAFLLWLVRAG